MKSFCTFCLLDISVGGEGVCLFKSRIKDVSVSSDSLVEPVEYHLENLAQLVLSYIKPARVFPFFEELLVLTPTPDF